MAAATMRRDSETHKATLLMAHYYIEAQCTQQEVGDHFGYAKTTVSRYLSEVLPEMHEDLRNYVSLVDQQMFEAMKKYDFSKAKLMKAMEDTTSRNKQMRSRKGGTMHGAKYRYQNKSKKEALL